MVFTSPCYRTLIGIALPFLPKAFPGGFIGVDIFFTFSGFLITALLIDEFARKQGIDYLAFLKRRFYRIVPPLVFMVLVVMPFTFMVQRDYVAGIGTQIAAVFGFVTNFFEMATGGSYESNFIPHLFLHTWSLALEVHYYVLWALWHGSWLSGLRQLESTEVCSSWHPAGSFLFTFLSMFIRAFLTANFSTIYFSSFTHIFPFFAGSCLATVTGITNVSPNFTKLVQSWSMKKTLSVLGGALPSCLCSVFSCHLIACGPICLAF